MASFGGSQWGGASQPQTPSPFGTNIPSSDSKSSPFSANPFGAAATSSSSQGKRTAVFGSAFSTSSSTTGTQPNPFSTAPTTSSGFKNPFDSAGSGQATSIFSQNNNKPQGLSAFGQPSRSPSPFGTPSNQGGGLPSTTNGPTKPLTTSAPSASNRNLQPGGFGPKGGYGATSEGDESFGSDGASDSKWSKHKRRNRQSGDTSDAESKKGGPSRPNKTGPIPDDGQPGPFETKRNGFTNGTSSWGTKPQSEKKTNGAAPSAKPFGVVGSKPPAPSKFGSNAAANTESINTDDPFGRKVFDQLQRDNLRPPKWPADPGHPSSKGALAAFKEEYKAYRARVRASLVRADLIDDPEQRRRLEDALDFKGICEDMCPDFEKITRMTEFDVKQAEKDPGTQRVDTRRMVKKLARSAAGQEAPLPMDVRSIGCLKRTLNYLVDDLLQSDDNLPVMHGFLWDRTRAIRRDFAFFSSMTPEELKGQVYCLETIARFHVTSLHLMAQRGFAPEDFSEQQEIEQLGKTLISLMYAYNDCNGQGIECENETEFRAYQLVFRANQPDVLDTLQQEWDPKFFESDVIRTAVSLVEALQNTKDFHGPLRTGPSHSSSGAYNTYFRIVEDPSVSYTMACFAEIHFAQLRRSILAALRKGFSRPKQTPKDITPEVVNKYLRFDTTEEVVDFVEKHGLRFEPSEDEPDNPDRQYLYLEYGQFLEYPRIHHTFSQSMVERKRGSHTFPDLIHNNIFESPSSPVQDRMQADEDSLFVTSSDSPREREPKKQVHFNMNSLGDSPASTPRSPLSGIGGIGGVGGSMGPQKGEDEHALVTPPTPVSPEQYIPEIALPGEAEGDSPPQVPSQHTPKASQGTESKQLPPPPPPPPPPACGTVLPSEQSQARNAVLPPTPPDTPDTPVLTLTPVRCVYNTDPDNLATDEKAQHPSPFAPPAAPSRTSQFPGSSTGPPKNPFSSLGSNTAPQSTPSFTPSTTTQQPFAPVSKAPTPTFSFTPSPQTQPSTGTTGKGSVFSAQPPKAAPGPSFTFTKPALSSSSLAAPLTSAISTAVAPAPTDEQESPTIKITPPTPAFPPTATATTSTSKPLGSPGVSSTPIATTDAAVPKAAPTFAFAPAPQNAAPASTSVAPAIPRQATPTLLDAHSKKEALWAGFTNWIVNGDNGIMDHFERYIVEELVTEAYNKFEEEEAERIRKEEDEKSWAEARKFRTYSLKVKFFYRWRKIAHENRARSLRRSGRDQVRAWREAKLAEKRAQKEKEERQKKRWANEASRYEKVEDFKDHLKRRKLSLQEAEEALLASGVLSGVSNEREAAARIVRSKDVTPEPRRPAVPAFMHKIKSGISQSVAKIKPGGAKTQALRDEFLNGGSLRDSFRSSSRGSRFSTPSLSESGRSQSRSRTMMSSRWQLKAMGLETMPDGSVLPDCLAYPMLQGKRFDGLGNHGVQPMEHQHQHPRTVSAADADLRPATADGLGFARGHKSTASLPVINGGEIKNKRKRSAGEAEVEVDAETGSPDDADWTSPSRSKRIYLDSQKTIAEMRKLREEMAEGMDWFREQNEKLQSEISSRGGTPWK